MGTITDRFCKKNMRWLITAAVFLLAAAFAVRGGDKKGTEESRSERKLEIFIEMGIGIQEAIAESHIGIQEVFAKSRGVTQVVFSESRAGIQEAVAENQDDQTGAPPEAADSASSEGISPQEEPEAKKNVPCDRQDYDTLLKIVQAEAGGCDSWGKILVANVIMNRVKSSEFPNGITEVVYEKSQFSPVSDGSINQVKVTQETINCVDRALKGEDYSQGALYFMNRRTSGSHHVRWFDGKLTFLFGYGGHEFFK